MASSGYIQISHVFNRQNEIKEEREYWPVCHIHQPRSLCLAGSLEHFFQRQTNEQAQE